MTQNRLEDLMLILCKTEIVADTQKVNDNFASFN